jgi:hypothetical protein
LITPSTRLEQGFAIDPQGAAVSLPFLRLFTLIRIGGARTPRIRECLIDTGAPLSVFPEWEWRLFAAEVEWLAPAPGHPFPWWLTRFTGMTGGSCPCRPGRIVAEPVGYGPGAQVLSATPLVALFAEDGSRPEDEDRHRILMGLHGGILEGRRLIVEADARQAWLEDR